MGRTLSERYGPIVAELRELARKNLADFRSSPELLKQYETALAGDAFRYTSDRETCGRPDCWSTFRELREQLEVSGGDVFELDCEDDACALAAWHAVQGAEAFIGLIPGRRVSHAVAGIMRDGAIVRLDPALWHGMPNEIDYARPHLWARVSD